MPLHVSRACGASGASFCFMCSSKFLEAVAEQGRHQACLLLDSTSSFVLQYVGHGHPYVLPMLHVSSGITAEIYQIFALFWTSGVLVLADG